MVSRFFLRNSQLFFGLREQKTKKILPLKNVEFCWDEFYGFFQHLIAF